MKEKTLTQVADEVVLKPLGLPTDADISSVSVRNQPHYTNFQIQPAEFIAANNLDYFQGNVIKYICRFRGKNGIQDLRKAAHYIEMLIEKEQTGKLILTK